jgi:short-subunit dehydrogenase
VKGAGVLLVGGSSGIGRALAREMAARGACLHLAARDDKEADRIAQDLVIRYGAQVSHSAFDVTAYESHSELVERAAQTLGRLDIVVVCVGELGDQLVAQTDAAFARRIIETNYVGVVSVLTHAANFLERQRGGAIIAIGSVAGDRGRASNYVYGSAKSGLDRFLQGLRARLFRSGVHVLTVKPGFVDTRMTFGLPGVVLACTPARVAQAAIHGLDRRRNILYVPWWWFWIMLAVRAVPESVFKRLAL